MILPLVINWLRPRSQLERATDLALKRRRAERDKNRERSLKGARTRRHDVSADPIMKSAL